jgi:hypothetical protein
MEATGRAEQLRQLQFDAAAVDGGEKRDASY